MQENVKVFTPEVLVEIFGHLNVKDDFTYKLKTDQINSRELKELANVNDVYGMNFHIRRSDKGLIVYSPSIDSGKKIPEQPVGQHKTVRDYYELVLPQEARVFAFENTARIKLDRKASSLSDAIMQSFYISDTPQGAEYWQEVILENTER